MMKRILLIAYACEPGKGSEPGVGWNLALKLSEKNLITVITRKDVEKKIKTYISQQRLRNLRFEFIEIPFPFYKFFNIYKMIQIHYAIWNLCAYLKAQKIVRREKIDIVHHLTFVNNWIPPFTCLTNKPFIWGPIGTHPKIPLNSLNDIKLKMRSFVRFLILDILRIMNPFTYVAIMRAKKIITINEQCKRMFPFGLVPDAKIAIIPAVAIEENWINENPRKNHNRNTIELLFVGVPSYIKGVELLLHSFAKALEKNRSLRLTIVGDGPMRKWIERFAKKRNLEDKITLTGMIPRQEVQIFYEKADIFLYPSFEGGSIATLEAMAYGLPIICLNFGGPGQFVSKECGIKVEVGQFEKMVNHLSQAILRLAENEQLRLEMGENARNRVKNLYTWSKKAEDINKIYQEVLRNENSDYS